MNLNDIIQSAQGGQGINNIAQQFGISPEQAQAAIQAMLPGLSHGLPPRYQASSQVRSSLPQLAACSTAPAPVTADLKRVVWVMSQLVM